MSSSEDTTCAICLGSIETGKGHAIFTAECSHCFHFSCILLSVSHGNYLCPVCRAKWNDLPLLTPNVNVNANSVVQIPPPRPTTFRQNPIGPLPTVTTDPTSNAGSQNVSIETIPERQAVIASESLDNFSVLARLKAPPLSDDSRQSQRAPIDLVTVLDVSGSMRGPKLDLLKCAVSFVIDNLGPSDRLSVVCFSTHARRILNLCRMTETGRLNAKRAVDSLLASGSTNIVDGLTKGVRVLEERRHRNPVASIIFLSDGRDTCNDSPRSRNLLSPRQPPDFSRLLPASICPGGEGGSEIRQTIPVHAFGFGSDHDPVAMHSISNSSGGTFSFVESYEILQDAFANCIGGLLSVVIQELRLTIKSASPGVEIKSISSGRYHSETSDRGSNGSITVGDLYADEEKDFMIHISVPTHTTSLLDIACSYRDILSNTIVRIEGGLVEIQRSDCIAPSDMALNLEVDRQLNRLSAAEGIAEAQRVAEMGDLSRARAVLSDRRSSVLASASGQAGDDLSMWLEAEMKETEERMESLEIYERTGRAYALSNMSAHSYQRANSSFDAYATPSMVNMVIKSQQINKREDGPSREG